MCFRISLQHGTCVGGYFFICNFVRHMCIILYIAFWYDVHVNEHYTLKYAAFLYGGAI